MSQSDKSSRSDAHAQYIKRRQNSQDPEDSEDVDNENCVSGPLARSAPAIRGSKLTADQPHPQNSSAPAKALLGQPADSSLDPPADPLLGPPEALLGLPADQLSGLPNPTLHKTRRASISPEKKEPPRRQTTQEGASLGARRPRTLEQRVALRSVRRIAQRRARTSFFVLPLE